MTKKELKQKLIDIRNGAFITPILEEIWKEKNASQVLDEAIEEIGKLPDLIYLGEDNKTEITLADGIWRDDVINTLERMKKWVLKKKKIESLN